jgi:hypothetical protein
VDARAVTDREAAAGSGVRNAAELLAFADAAVAGEPAALGAARARLLEALGPAALVDAAAVVANFERMVRIADGTGIPLDAPVAALAADLRQTLGLGRFNSAANTPAVGLLGRVAGPLLRRVVPRLLRLAASRRGPTD